MPNNKEQQPNPKKISESEQSYADHRNQIALMKIVQSCDLKRGVQGNYMQKLIKFDRPSTDRAYNPHKW